MSRRARWLCGLVAAASVTLLCAPPAAATPGPVDAPEYWFDDWRVQSLWASGARGQGITIAEIDTGVAKIPELSGRVLRGKDFGSDGGDGRTDREVDEFGHGTAMASIMVARSGLLSITGIAPGAKVLPIAVPLAGTTNAGEPDHLSEAIRYAADRGAKIISMSLGGKRSSGVDDRACSDEEQSAVFHALAKGAIVTASIGNSGPRRNAIEDPAVCLGVVSVGAIDSAGKVADFSTRQPFLTLVAPGVGIPSLSRVAGDAYSGDGTSQATALTSAALAVVWSKYPKLTGRAVVARVLATLDGRRSSPSSAYGYGSLDLYRAVTRRVAADAPNPVYAAAAPFLTRSTAISAGVKALRAPRAAADDGSTGDYAVGSAPRFTSPQVLVGGALGGTGLVLLIALVAGGVLARRRRSAAQVAAVLAGHVPAGGGPGGVTDVGNLVTTGGWPHQAVGQAPAGSSPDALTQAPAVTFTPVLAPPSVAPAPPSSGTSPPYPQGPVRSEPSGAETPRPRPRPRPRPSPPDVRGDAGSASY